MCAKHSSHGEDHAGVSDAGVSDAELGDAEACDVQERDASPKVSSSDFEDDSIKKTSNVKFVVSVGVVIFSMVFNGTIYGYTSPALLSMQHDNMVDRYMNSNDSNNFSSGSSLDESNSSITDFSYDVEIIKNEP